MLAIEGYEQFEQPVCLAKFPSDRGTCQIQRWRLPTKPQADELFTVLLAALDGDPNVGPILIQPCTSSDPRPVVTVMWRSATAAIREQMRAHFDDVEPMVRQVDRALNPMR